jgi:hypothetical protein
VSSRLCSNICTYRHQPSIEKFPSFMETFLSGIQNYSILPFIILRICCMTSEKQKMQIHIGQDTSLFWDTSTTRAEIFPVGYVLFSLVLVCAGSIVIICGLLRYRVPGGSSTTCKEGNTNVTRTFVWMWKWEWVAPCNSMQKELHRRGMCTYASYLWWSAREFRWGRTVVWWKIPQTPSRHFEHKLI